MEDWTYSYNNLDWLLSATNAGNAALSETFTYSATGNLLTRTRLSGASGRVTAASQARRSPA
ncbi:MAG: HECT domain-containing protein [Mesorhizobium sp.]|nr:HECT domain-containing protein [Mesorhizobium sp.]